MRRSSPFRTYIRIVCLPYISSIVEKKALDNSLVDLEFRFNELVVTNDDDEEVTQEDNQQQSNESGHGSSVSSTTNNSSAAAQPSTASTRSSESNDSRIHSIEIQNQIKSIIERLEGKVHQMDFKIADIGRCFELVSTPSPSILHSVALWLLCHMA